MEKLLGIMIRCSVVLVGILLSPPAQAGRVDFIATDLADTTPGQDLWRYDYTVSDRVFLEFEFLDIYFDPALYGTLTAGPAPNPDWDVAILQQPAPANLPPFDRGMFDAFALADGASLSGLFSVSFVYLGAGMPGAQPFEIFDAGSTLIESGMTTLAVSTPIPEPSTTALFLTGVFGCVVCLRYKSQIRR